METFGAVSGFLMFASESSRGGADRLRHGEAASPCYTDDVGGVAQRQSRGLLSPRFRVRIPAPSPTREAGYQIAGLCLFAGKAADRHDYTTIWTNLGPIRIRLNTEACPEASRLHLRPSSGRRA